MPSPKFPLTPKILNEFKDAIRWWVENFRTREVNVDRVLAKGGRSLVTHIHYPTREAFEYFANAGAGRLLDDWPKLNQGLPVRFMVVDDEYFQIDFSSLPVAIDFSIDKRVEADLELMLGLYAALYDIENRLRYLLSSRLRSKHGAGFLSSLPRRVRDRMEREMTNVARYVTDLRTNELEFSYFPDLKAIIEDQPNLLPNAAHRTVLLEKLPFLEEVRNVVAHGNRMKPGEAAAARSSCAELREILGKA